MSVDQLPSGSFRIRWREWEQDEATGVRRRVQRSLVVSDSNTATIIEGHVVKAIERGEPYERPDVVRVVPTVASVDAVLEGFVRARKARGIAYNTVASYLGHVSRILRALRALFNVAEGKAVPGSLLTRDTLVRLTQRLRDGGPGQKAYSEGTAYDTVRFFLEAWTWACDDAVTYPGIAPAPRDRASVLPRPVQWTARPAPTMAECDALIRWLAALRSRTPHANVALPLAVIARWTGLRADQVLELRVGNVHLAAWKDADGVAHGSLDVRTGKSRREKLGRTVPIGDGLRDYLVALVAGRDPEEFLVQRRADARKVRFTDQPSNRPTGRPAATLRKGWDAVSAAGEARREVWEGRPEHCFRGAFQDHLVREGVRDEVIDLLVGHAGGGLRARHYVDPSARWAAMWEAVSKLPPIDWREAADNVVRPNFGG